MSKKKDRNPLPWQVQELTDRLHKERATLGKYKAALIECAAWAGADISGGPPTWPPIHEWAVEEVKQLRKEYELAIEELDGKTEDEKD